MKFRRLLGLCIVLSATGPVQAEKQPAVRVESVASLPLLVNRDGNLRQIIEVRIRFHGNTARGTIRIGEGPETAVILEKDPTPVFQVPVPAVQKETSVIVTANFEGTQPVTRVATIRPVRRWEVYILPHSHVDIGYTQLQSVVEALHWDYFQQAIRWAEETQDYPEGSRFKWNVEVLWAVDSYLQQAPEEKRREFIEAVRRGWIGLDALYGNELTGLCRPEEMIRLTDLARRLSKEHDLTIDSAMISDVPGSSWGIVPILARSGVRYFSIGPNSSARIGFTLSDWGDRPFYWVSQSGQETILAWVAGKGYSWFHRGRIEDDDRIVRHLMQLEASGYPFEILQARYSIGGDNGPPDIALCSYVRDWNEKYVSPKLRIATTKELFKAFEERYSDQIPTAYGDFTPYWEDGAASSARETALNRQAAERLVQANALWSLLAPDRYPANSVRKTWRNIILYDEHTWGSHNSITEPDSDFAKGQWAVKQAFALDADRDSKKLISEALRNVSTPSERSAELLVFNTCSWPRTDLVLLSPDTFEVGNSVVDDAGTPVPSQVLSTGDLAFLARDVPSFGSKRYSIRKETAEITYDRVSAEETVLSGPGLRIEVDPRSGAVTRLESEVSPTNLAATGEFQGLNSYHYVPGTDPHGALGNGPVSVQVKEEGPLVASLVVTATAPGCYHLKREIRIVAGIDRLELINHLDKRKIRDKEGVHFGFPFQIPDGRIRMDIGWGVIRPDSDQLPGSCKNWFTVQRWVDVSNQNYGVTLATVDAPLIEVGGITAETPWIRYLGPTQTFYSYVMNNYWFTNYKADQEGPTTFRYAILPHGRYDSAQATRFGIEQSQPLPVVPVEKGTASVRSLLTVKPAGVIATNLKPCEDGNGLVLRLYGASARPEDATIVFDEPNRWRIFESDFFERRGETIHGPIRVSPYGIVTVRLEPK